MSIHSIHEKLPVGTENIETVLIYQQRPDHPDPGKEFDENMFRNVRNVAAPDAMPSEDGRLVELGMKRSLEEPEPNEGLAIRSKIFGVWRADDATEWGASATTLSLPAIGTFKSSRKLRTAIASMR